MCYLSAAFVNIHPYYLFCFFFFNDTATTEIYTLSLHDALPILDVTAVDYLSERASRYDVVYHLLSLSNKHRLKAKADRKSTRLNSSHGYISYAVFCLKKKNNNYYSSLF